MECFALVPKMEALDRVGYEIGLNQMINSEEASNI